MAVAINGYTIHNWSGIPIRNDDGNSCGDKHKQSMKCQALRVIIIDEVSMVSAELFGSLEYVVKGAIRPKGTYKSDAMAKLECLVELIWLCAQTFGNFIQCQELSLQAIQVLHQQIVHKMPFRFFGKITSTVFEHFGNYENL